MKINKIRLLGLLACFSMSVAMAGCQENPEESVVVNKDMDNLIEEATKEDDEGFDLEEDAGKYNTYKTEITNEALGVHVTVDAKVDIPQTDKLSMYKVEQKPLSQELMDAIRRELIGDETLYQGEKIYELLKSDIERIIAYYREDIASLVGDNQSAEVLSEEYIKEQINEIQKRISEYEVEYESAPKELIFEKKDIFDGKIKSVASLYEKDKKNSTYEWYYESNPKGDVYHAVTDGSNGNYKVIYAHNSVDCGTTIRYRSCNYGYAVINSQISTNDKNGRCLGRKVIKGQLAHHLPGVVEDDYLLFDEKTTISKEEAIKTADKFLQKIGLEEFKCYEGDIYTEYARIESYSENLTFRTYYILTYMRTVDGVFVNPNDGVKSLDVSYITEWPVEEIEIFVNDTGIVGFDYVAPLTLTEVVVDDTHMKTYEDIIKTFEDMVAIKHAVQSEDEKMEITVNRVSLSYARICDEDSLNRGFLIPVWDFQGKSKLIKHGNSYTTNDVMTINAIDGTVIDRALGY